MVIDAICHINLYAVSDLEKNKITHMMKNSQKKKEQYIIIVKITEHFLLNLLCVLACSM